MVKLFLIFIFLSLQSQAFLEKKLSASALYNPVGTGISLGLAYNYKLWGQSDLDIEKTSEKPPEKKSWMYGYIRPKVQADISGLINGAAVELQIFPISIFGVTFGSQYIDRHIKKTAYFDCDLVNCENELNRDYWKINLALSYSGFVSLLQYQKDRYQIRDDNQLFMEYSSLLLLSKDQLNLEKKIAFLGHEITDQLTLGLLEFYQELGPKKAEAQFLTGMYKYEDKKIFAGIGTSGSDYTEKYIALFVKLTWVLDLTLSLVD